MNDRLPFDKINDYKIQYLIQDGSYCMSVKAHQLDLDRSVFIKFLKPSIRNHTEWLTRFRREAKICARLKHPHIVDVYEIGDARGYTYIVMQFIQGMGLKDLLSIEKSLEPDIALEITSQILQALAFAHQNNIIHRDLKPGNILLDIHGHSYLTDFGLAYIGQESSITQQNSIVGTPAYMAPEQITGEPIRPATDIFALGTMLYELLTGIKPFAGENHSNCIQKILNTTPEPVSRIRPETPPLLADLVTRMMKKDPSQRPQSVQDLLSEINESMRHSKHTRSEMAGLVSRNAKPNDQPISQYPEKSNERAGYLVNKKIALITAGFVLLFTLFIAILYPWFNPDSDRKRIAVQQMENQTDITDKIETDSVSKVPHQESQSVRKSIIAQTPKIQSSEAKTTQTNNYAQIPTPKPDTGQSTEAQKFSLELEIEPWANLYINSKQIDSIVYRKTLNLKPGHYNIILTHPEFTPKVFNLNLVSGESQNIKYSFYQDAGYLNVQVRPWAHIYLDGKLIGTSPLNRAIVTRPGEHVLELRHPHFEPYRQLVLTQKGDTLWIRKRLSN